jgi:hypothetical protein
LENGRLYNFFEKWKTILIFWQRENKLNILTNERQKYGSLRDWHCSSIGLFPFFFLSFFCLGYFSFSWGCPRLPLVCRKLSDKLCGNSCLNCSKFKLSFLDVKQALHLSLHYICPYTISVLALHLCKQNSKLSSSSKDLIHNLIWLALYKWIVTMFVCLC